MTTPLTAPIKQAPSIATVAASAPIGFTEFCDRCVGRAVARATVNGTALRFCGHHLKPHRAALGSNPAIILHVEDVTG